MPTRKQARAGFSKSKIHPIKRKNSAVAVIVMVAFIVVIAILYSGRLHSEPTSPTTPSVVQVNIENGAGADPNSPGYSPATVTVIIGINNTVKWVNDDSISHTVTAVDGSFDSGNIDPGQSFIHAFNTPGTYTYVCIYHHWIQGTVIVLPSTNE